MQTDTPFAIGHDVRGVGKWARVLLGVAGVGLALLGTSRTGLYAQAAVYFVAIASAYFAGYLLLGPRVLARMNPWVGTVLLVGPAVVVPALDVLPVSLRMAMIAYFSASMVLNALMNYGGCEVLAVPSLIFRRWYTVYCPLNVIDAVENAIVGSRASAKSPEGART